MIVYKFRMLSDENDHFVRDYEVPATMTLLELHDFIIDSLDYEPCITSFYTADKQWERLREFTTVDMGFASDDDEIEAPVAMEKAILCEILHYMNDRLIYNFDLLGNRAYYLELIDAQEGNSPEGYPRESFAHATPPDQYDADASQQDGSIFDEMMDDFGGDYGSDDYDADEY